MEFYGRKRRIDWFCYCTLDVAMLYVMIVMMNTEMGSVMPEAGGQYTMAKYMLGTFSCI